LNSDTYLQINSNVKVYQFGNGLSKVVPILQKMVLFKGAGKFNLGQNIHRLMSRFIQPGNYVYNYLPAELDVEVIEKKIADDTVVRSALVQGIKFVAGLSFGNTSGISILQFNSKPESAKKNSIAFINCLIPGTHYALHIFKNNQFEYSISLPNPYGYIISQQISFFNYVQGDVIDVNLGMINDPNTALAIPQSKRFHMLPEGLYNNIIKWEDEFLLQQSKISPVNIKYH